MQATKFDLIRFLDGDLKFIIPVYQRRYDWRKEQCQQLCDDLQKLMQDTDRSHKHFFGTIVCMYPYSHECVIIDGQQRLTTISLIMLALCSLIDEGLQTENPRRSARLRDNYLLDHDDERQPKFRHVKEDREAFTCLLRGQAERAAPDSNMTVNYSFFRKWIREQQLDPERLVKALERLEIVKMELDHYDDPQEIFESLNSTGLRLSEGDKVRNYLLMNISDPDQQQRWYEDYWLEIEVSCRHADGSTALDGFLMDYLIARTTTSRLRWDKIYEDFKTYCRNRQRLEVLEDLRRSARCYHILLLGGSGIPELDQCIRRLNYLGSSVTRPFLLEVLLMHQAQQLDETELLGIFAIVESFIARRLICAIASNSLRQVFQTLHRNILREGEAVHGDYVDRFNYYLTCRWGGVSIPGRRRVPVMPGRPAALQCQPRLVFSRAPGKRHYPRAA